MTESDSVLASLQQRVERLEVAVHALQDARPVELRDVKIDSCQPSPEHPAPEPDPVQVNHAPLAPRSPWLLADILGEARAMVRMFFDIRYRMAWYTRISVLLLLALIVTSNLWLGWVPFLGFFLIKLWDLVLAFLAYKILSREARRYREMTRT